MINIKLEPVGSKKQNLTFCYNCGHSILMHAYYPLLEGHLVMEYETVTFQTIWLGFPMTVEMPYPVVRKGVCSCKRFISKKDYELEIERNG
jgi:hypothetical protein